MKSFALHSLRRWGGALLLLCLLAPLLVCTFACDDCSAAECCDSGPACLCHGLVAVMDDTIDLVPARGFDRAPVPASPVRALLLPPAIFRPPIA